MQNPWSLLGRIWSMIGNDLKSENTVFVRFVIYRFNLIIFILLVVSKHLSWLFSEFPPYRSYSMYKYLYKETVSFWYDIISAADETTAFFSPLDGRSIEKSANSAVCSLPPQKPDCPCRHLVFCKYWYTATVEPTVMNCPMFPVAYWTINQSVKFLAVRYVYRISYVGIVYNAYNVTMYNVHRRKVM